MVLRPQHASYSPAGFAKVQIAGPHPQFLIQWVQDGDSICISNKVPDDNICLPRLTL